VKMKFRSAALLTLAMALAFAPVALADSFDFSFTSLNPPNGVFGGGIVSGNLSTTYVSPGVYDITSGSIDITGGTSAGNYVTGMGSLVPTTGMKEYSAGPPESFSSPSGSFFFDNLLYMNNPSQELDGAGLLFMVGGDEINIYGNGSPNSYSIGEYQSGSPVLTDVGDFNATSVIPEPTSLLLLGTGLFGLAGALFISKHATS